MERTRLLSIVVTVAATLALPASASAAVEVRLASQGLQITGTALAEDVTVLRTAGGYHVDASRNLDAILPCVELAGEVACQSSGQVPIRAEMRAGDDSVTLLGVTSRATLFGENGEDKLSGGDAADVLDGGNGWDRLIGRGGADLLTGGPQPDVHDGGPGVDTASYVDHTGNVVADLTQGTGGAPSDIVTNLVGVTTRDTYVAAENLVGSPGFDTLIGNAAANDLDGFGSDDILLGRGGDDVLDGGAGPDQLQGDAGRDTVTYAARGEGIRVTLDGDNNDGAREERDDVRDDIEVIEGGSGDDHLTGSDAAQELRGNGGEDTLDGRGGDDVLDGGAGFLDALTGGDGRDVLRGGPGFDTVSYEGRGNGVVVTLNGVADDGGPEDAGADNVDAEFVAGTDHDDTLVGGAGPDIFDGLGGADVLHGGGGADFLTGDAGLDLLLGEDGDDTLKAEDGEPDRVACGLGTDAAALDASDVSAGDCESGAR